MSVDAARSERALFAAKLWFVSFYGALGFILPYFNLLLQHYGYAGWQLGVISALRPFVSATCNPLWAALADKYQLHRRVFLLALVVTVALRASLGLLATPFAYLVVLVITLETFGGPTYVMSDAAIVGAAMDDGDYGRCRVWACLAWGVAGAACSPLMHFTSFRFAFLAYGVVSLFAIAAGARLDFSFVAAPPHASAHAARAVDCEAGDAAGMRAGGGHSPTCSVQQGGSMSCNEQRSMSGAQDACAAEPVTAADLQPPILAAEAAALHRRSCDMAHAADSAHAVTLDAASHTGRERVGSGCIEEPLLSKASAGPGSVASAEHHLTFGQKYWRLLQQRSMVLFLAKALLMGVCVGVIDGYLFVYLDALGAPVLLMGACLSVVCVVELPVFMHSGRILALLGYQGSLRTALGAFCLRLAAYAAIARAPSLWLVVPVETLHAVTFGIAWTAGVNFCKREAPPGLQGSAQSLFVSVYFGLGRGVGGLAGGLMYDFYGGAALFQATLVVVLLLWALVSVAESVPARRRSTQPVDSVT